MFFDLNHRSNMDKKRPRSDELANNETNPRRSHSYRQFQSLNNGTAATADYAQNASLTVYIALLFQFFHSTQLSLEPIYEQFRKLDSHSPQLFLIIHSQYLFF